MNNLEFNLDSLMVMQYNPLRKVLEYLLERDNVITNSLSKLDQRANEHDKKFTEVHTNMDEILALAQNVSGKYESRNADCN